MFVFSQGVCVALLFTSFILHSSCNELRMSCVEWKSKMFPQLKLKFRLLTAAHFRSQDPPSTKVSERSSNNAVCCTTAVGETVEAYYHLAHVVCMTAL